MTEVIYAISNIGIALGYIFICLVVVPSFPVRLLQTKIGGGFFFLTCGLTHAHLAYHGFVKNSINHRDLFSTINHIVQVFAVWVFIWGLYQEFVRPKNVRIEQDPA